MPKQMQKTLYTPKNAPQDLLKLLNVLDKSSKVLTQNNFYFALSKLFKGKRIIMLPKTPYNEMQHLEAENLIHKKIKEQNIKDSQEQSEISQVLASEYKIHLMPKPEYILPVVAEFLIGCHRNPVLYQHIQSFKIVAHPAAVQSIVPGTSKNTILPHMVIYLNLGKESANFVLKTLYEMYSEFDIKEIGLGIPPRYSLACNGLISYAQGGGDIKKIMTEQQKTKFLSQSEVHFNLPDQHLDNPAFIDLKLLAEVFTQAASTTALKFQNIMTCDGILSCLLPHVRMSLEFPQNSENPSVLRQDDLKLLQSFSAILKKFSIKGRLLSPPLPITRFQGNLQTTYNKLDLVVCLPGDINIIRKRHQELLDNCQKCLVSEVSTSSKMEVTSNKNSSVKRPLEVNSNENNTIDLNNNTPSEKRRRIN